MTPKLTIREARPDELEPLGQLMVDVYSKLEGFPSPEEQPQYYEKLSNVGRFTKLQTARVLVALSESNEMAGGVVYFGDMADYGSGGKAPEVKNASGIRLLGVAERFRGSGAGRALTDACIELARKNGHAQVILHTTHTMKVAWGMYERLGFERATDLDFMQESLPVVGFRLKLNNA